MELKKLLGANLKSYRKAKKLSQEELSEKVDISVKHLSKIERGLTFVSAELLEKLSDNLGVSVATLFCNENESIDNDNVFKKFDRITEKHLIKAEKHLSKAMERIKEETRQEDNGD
ncbi:MAG: helix-turn-helix domain-containing protein [Spirochaetes bacterium]|nr:helix-turn-helix domain-containing protein [Spirochaetota bacterium]